MIISPLKRMFRKGCSRQTTFHKLQVKGFAALNAFVKKGLAGVLLCVFAAVSFAQQPAAPERIERFDAKAVVKTDASVSIQERIVFNVTGEQIKRGIIRVLPLQGVSNYRVESVSLDGKPVRYSVRKSYAEHEITIGDPNKILAPGLHTYEIVYQARGAVRFQEKFDEFYWNVTGNEWAFPIQAASLQLVLPQGAQIVPGGISLYMGRKGEKGADSARAVNNSFFYTIRPLKQGEGFTVSAAWNKGIVVPPPAPQRKTYWQRVLQYRTIIPLSQLAQMKEFQLLFGFWLVLLVYYYLVWNKVGRDPQARVIRQFEPPQGLSPAQVRYLRQMKDDEKTVSVVVMSLVEKKYLRVQQEGKGNYILSKTETQPEKEMSEEEQSFFKVLFRDQNSVEVDKKNQEILSAAQGYLSGALIAWEDKRFFSHNAWANVPSFLLLGGLLWVQGQLLEWGTTLGFLVQMVLICTLWGYPMFNILWKGRRPKILNAKNFFLCVLAVLTLLAFGWPMAIAVVLLLVPGIVFSNIIPAYTAQGREYMDQIEGFLQYLEVAETNRVFASDPTDASRIYCAYLPYAAALDVQNKWQNAFQAEIGEAAVEKIEEENGLSYFRRDMAFSMALSRALTPVEQASVSSSGFDGGGFSGGGSGGGGGRGW